MKLEGDLQTIHTVDDFHRSYYGVVEYDVLGDSDDRICIRTDFSRPYCFGTPSGASLYYRDYLDNDIKPYKGQEVVVLIRYGMYEKDNVKHSITEYQIRDAKRYDEEIEAEKGKGR